MDSEIWLSIYGRLIQGLKAVVAIVAVWLVSSGLHWLGLPYTIIGGMVVVALVAIVAFALIFKRLVQQHPEF